MKSGIYGLAILLRILYIVIGTFDDKEVIIMSKPIITGNASPQEAENYISYIEEKYGMGVKTLNIELDGEYANLTYELDNVPFERVRRITGYLVGTMDKWNDAKKAEEADRVTHSVQMPGCCSLEDMADLTSEKDTALHS